MDTTDSRRPASNPAGWRGAASGQEEIVTLSEFLRGKRAGRISVGQESEGVLSRIKLDGLRVSLVVGPSIDPGGFCDKGPTMPLLGPIRLTSMLVAHGARVVTRHFVLEPVFSTDAIAALSDRERLLACVAGQTDLELEALVSRWVAAVLDDSPQIVGLSANSRADPLSFLLFLRRLREIRPGITVVLGGFWNGSELTGAQLSEFDHLVIEEGDLPLLLICASVVYGRGAHRIPGVLRYQSSGAGSSSGSGVSHNLDLLPPISLEGQDLSLYDFDVYMGWQGVTLPYQFVVGCPSNCAYCNLQTKRRFKLRSPAKVVGDLSRLSDDYGIDQFMFLNSAFNVDRAYSEELLEAMIAAGHSWRWSDCCRPANMDDELLGRLRRAGCEWLNWGLDTASPRLDRIYRRGISRSDFADLLRRTRRAGICNAVNVIVGMPHETDQDLAELTEFLDQNRESIDNVFVYQYYFVPHSDMGQRPERYGLRLSADGQGVDEIDGMSWSERRAWGAHAHDRLRYLANRPAPADEDTAIPCRWRGVARGKDRPSR